MKHKDLLNRIEIFERLAVYGNRKAFLTAIAVGSTLSPELKQEIGHVADMLHFDGEESLGKQIVDLAGTSDAQSLLSLLDQAKVFYNRTDPNSNSYQVVVDAYNKLKQSGTSGAGLSGIDPYVQKALHYLGAPGGLQTDGKFGPLTRKALDWFKNQNGIADDAAAMAEAKRQFQQKFPLAQTGYNDPTFSDKEINPIDLKLDPTVKQPGPLPRPIDYYIDKYKNQT